MILALGVKTSGLPAPGMTVEHPQYPWPVEIGAILFDFSGTNHAVLGTRIRADGRAVAKGAEAVHGISAREAGRTGVPEIVALSMVCHFAGQARYLTGYNVTFDVDVLHASIIRLGQDPKRLIRPGLQVVDLMRPSASFCKLAGEAQDGAYRWPRLQDALTVIRHERPRQGRHEALKDAGSAKRLFLSLHHRKALDLGEAA